MAQSFDSLDNSLKDQLCCCALMEVSMAKQNEVACQNKITGGKEGREIQANQNNLGVTRKSSFSRSSVI